MKDTVILVLCSFGASFGLGIAFRVEKRFLFWAGFGGALTRVIYLLLLQVTDQSFVYSFFAAMAASLYAEIMAARTKRPSTVFLYPSIIPLLPGRLLYFTVIGMFMQDSAMISEYGIASLYSLIGLGLGFVAISMVMYYKRNFLHLQRLRDLAKVLPNSVKNNEETK